MTASHNAEREILSGVCIIDYNRQRNGDRQMIEVKFKKQGDHYQSTCNQFFIQNNKNNVNPANDWDLYYQGEYVETQKRLKDLKPIANRLATDNQ